MFTRNRTMVLLTFLAACLIAGAAEAAIIDQYGNGYFEDDAALVPNPGDTNPAEPAYWGYDTLNGTGLPVLMNVSAIGDGSGGTVGVRFPNYNEELGWMALLENTPDGYAGQTGIVHGAPYRYTVTYAPVDVDAQAEFLQISLYWVSDPSNPWAPGQYNIIRTLAGENIVVQNLDVSGDPNGQWQTLTYDFEVDPAVVPEGKYFYNWIIAQSYEGHIIVGEVSTQLIPEPSALAILATGLLGLLAYAWRKRK